MPNRKEYNTEIYFDSKKWHWGVTQQTVKEDHLQLRKDSVMVELWKNFN